MKHTSYFLSFIFLCGSAQVVPASTLPLSEKDGKREVVVFLKEICYREEDGKNIFIPLPSQDRRLLCVFLEEDEGPIGAALDLAEDSYFIERCFEQVKKVTGKTYEGVAYANHCNPFDHTFYKYDDDKALKWYQQKIVDSTDPLFKEIKKKMAQGVLVVAVSVVMNIKDVGIREMGADAYPKPKYSTRELLALRIAQVRGEQIPQRAPSHNALVPKSKAFRLSAEAGSVTILPIAPNPFDNQFWDKAGRFDERQWEKTLEKMRCKSLCISPESAFKRSSAN